MSRRKLIHIVSLGCPKTRGDSEMIAHVALAEGWRLTADPGEAGIVVVNTCAFVEEARRESIDAILGLAGAGKGPGRRLLGVAGCLAERYAADLAASLPEADRVVGLGRLEEIRAVLRGEPSPPGSGPRVMFPGGRYGREAGASPHSRYLKIGDGCSRRCAFCAIPSIRGPALSRGAGPILAEARDLAARGAREICVVSQDSTAWGRDLPGRPGLPGLARRLSRVRQIEWIRLLYLYPSRTVLDLVPLLAGGPPVLPYVDLPMQHVTDRMLGIMRRGHGRAHLDRIVGRLRDAIPGLTLRTTFVIGHPGETERDFEALLGFIEAHRPDRIGLIAYSPEEGTPAERMGGRVPPGEVGRRLGRAGRLARSVLAAKGRALVGTVASVMIDGPSQEGPYLHDARLGSQAPEVDGKVVVAKSPRALRAGEIVRVRIARAMGADLLADLE